MVVVNCMNPSGKSSKLRVAWGTSLTSHHPHAENREGVEGNVLNVLEVTTEPGFATSQLTGQVGPLGQGFSRCGPGHICIVFGMQILRAPSPWAADPESRG